MMGRSRFEATYRGLNSALKKVFDATPKTTHWLAPAISAEMRRIGSGGADSRMTLGCLNQLLTLGLVDEVEKGSFRQVQVKEKESLPELAQPINKPKEKEIMATITKPKETATSSPIDRLSKFAVRLRDLANEMEEAAIDLAGQAERNEQETAKMRQLQQLLKSLG